MQSLKIQLLRSFILLQHLQEDILIAGKAVNQQLGELVVKRISGGTKSLEVWNSLCMPRGAPDAALLLLPEEYELLHPGSSNGTLVEVLQVILRPPSLPSLPPLSKIIFHAPSPAHEPPC